MEEQPTPEQEAQELGMLLAQLLDAADIPDDQKEAWAVMIPEMSGEQLAKLARVLELNLETQGRKELEPLLSGIQEIEKKHQENVATAEKKADDQLKAIEDQLKSKE